MSKPSSGTHELGEQLEQVRDKLLESGETALAAATVAADKVAETARDVGDQLPQVRQDVQAALKSLVEDIRRNPRPFVAGAAAVGLLWLVSRRPGSR